MQLFVYPWKAHPRYCECRLLSSDLGKRCQGLSGSFNSYPLSRYCPPADQLIVASGGGGGGSFLRTSSEVTEKTVEHKTTKNNLLALATMAQESI